MTNPMEQIADLMKVSARTAPKAGGVDKVETKVLKGDELEELADEMIEYGEESGKSDFDRDGENVRDSEALLLVSVNDPEPVLLDCGACGYESCEGFEKRSKKGVLGESENPEEDNEFEGPSCVWRLIDLGIALGSAVKTASIHNADNRIMYRAGVAAKRMDIIDGSVVLGIPISAEGKNIYFDR